MVPVTQGWWCWMVHCAERVPHAVPSAPEIHAGPLVLAVALVLGVLGVATGRRLR